MTRSVLVVGDGIAGRAMSRALAQRGIGCTIVERRSEPARLGMGLNLPGNAVRALAELGVADDVVSNGMSIHRREYRNARGDLLFDTDEDKFWRGVGQPVCVRHGHLLRALLREGETAVERGSRVQWARPSGTHVEVQIEDEAAPRRYDYVIGADGVHSAVRYAVWPDAVQASGMTRSCWRLIGDNPGIESWTAWSGKSALFLLIPVEPGKVYGYAAALSGDDPGADPDWMQTAFTGFASPVQRVVDGALAGACELHHAAVAEVRLTSWHRGRLTLIGDAAHATGPVWAQGAAMAMEDALVLAELLAGHEDWDLAGAEFDRRRRPRVARVQRATDRMSRLAALPAWLRDRTAPWLGPRTYRSAYGPLREGP